LGHRSFVPRSEGPRQITAATLNDNALSHGSALLKPLLGEVVVRMVVDVAPYLRGTVLVRVVLLQKVVVGGREDLVGI
jgi:hypothetical protein